MGPPACEIDQECPGPHVNTMIARVYVLAGIRMPCFSLPLPGAPLPAFRRPPLPMATHEIDPTAEIVSLVLDRVQVVSYKWLSRKFSVTSNEAKRLLQMIVDKHGSNMEVIYAVSGWLKKNEQYHSVQLVPKSKLQEAKDMFDGHISVHVYSIQPSIPQDPADLWTAEYVQSHELFKQLPEHDNCLRDNRFSAVTCSSVSWKNFGKSESATKSAVNPSSLSKGTAKEAQIIAEPPASVKLQDAASISAGKQSVKSTGNEHVSEKIVSQGKNDSKPPITTSHAPVKVASIKEAKKETVDSSGGGALANLWGRASTKTKAAPPETHVETRREETGISHAKPLPHDGSIAGSCDDDDDATDFMHARRGIVKNNRKMRRMIIDDDLSDEEQDDSDKNKLDSGASPVVNPMLISSLSDEKSCDVKNKAMEKRKKLSPENEVARASPDDTPTSIKTECRGADLGTDEKAGRNLVKVKEERTVDRNLEKDSSDENVGKEISEEESVKKNTTSSAVASASKKRKVLKIRIDDHGREVTEVVWENENTDTSDDGKGHTNGNPKTNGEASTKTPDIIKSLGNKQSQAPSNKVNSNKPASKESQKGKISSFFKKKT